MRRCGGLLEALAAAGARALRRGVGLASRSGRDRQLVGAPGRAGQCVGRFDIGRIDPAGRADPERRQRTRIALAAAAALAPGAGAAAAGCATLGGAPAVSVDEERRLGREAQAEVEQAMEISRDPAVVNSIRDIGRRLVTANRLTEFD